MKLKNKEQEQKAVEAIEKIDEMTEEEIIRQHFKELAKISQVATPEELPGLTDALLSVYSTLEPGKGPLDSIKQVFNESIEKAHDCGNNTVQVGLALDGVKFGSLVHKYNKKCSTTLPESLESVIIDIPNKVFSVNGVSFDTSHNFNMSFENGHWYVSVEIPNTFKAAHWCKYDVNGKLISDENTGYVE